MLLPRGSALAMHVWGLVHDACLTGGGLTGVFDWSLTDRVY